MASDVRITGVTKKYKNVTAVDNLTLAIPEGEFVSILGPSGCGKTTTLRIIAGLAEADAGEVYIGGTDVTSVPPYRRNIGMVFQDYALFPHMTVRDNVAFGLRMRKIPAAKAHEKADEMLALVHLSGMGERRPNQLSGGQQQRVALARALAIEPSVLLLDEPLSNLDLKLRQEMRVELRRIQRRVGTTAVFVTHDQGEALSLSDRVIVMNQGRVEQEGNPVSLYENPRTRFVAAFLGDANFFRGQLNGGLVLSDGIMLEPRCGDANTGGKEVAVLVRPEKIRIGTEPTDGVNTAIGVIDSLTYLGSQTRYYIQLRTGRIVTVDSVETRVYSEGTEVTLAWSRNDCIVVKEDAIDAE